MQKVAVPVLILIIAAAIYAVFAQYKTMDSGHGHDESAEPQMQNMAGKADRGPMGGGPVGGGKAQEFGDKNAKIVVDAIVPTDTECHQKTVQLLEGFVKKHPKDVYVKVHNLHSPSGEQAKSKFGVTCATVLINGKYEFEANGKHLIFSKKPNDPGSPYQSEDVVTVLEQQLKGSDKPKG
ncbi:MAG: hypothetical protein IT210_12595 [Armatimonadetes bacterium]|nr:hypothetical protein [Armatimonadota bacterium]